MTRRKKKGVLGHYLISLALGPREHMHGYVMTCDQADTLDVANRMLSEAEKLGCSYPLMRMVLATPLVDDLEAVRKIVAARSTEAQRLLQEATDFHFTIFATCADDPADAQLMAMH
jgi:hypothetical protein